MFQDIDIIDPPRTFLRNADGSAVQNNVGLKVAKWQDAFTTDAAGNVSIQGPDGARHDFIDRDPDRFNVWVFDPWDRVNGVPYVDIRLSTLGNFDPAYNDPAVTLRLVPRPNDKYWYWSDSQMLVSNTADNGYSDANTAPNGSGPQVATNNKELCSFPVGDRLHLIALGGTVHAELSGFGGPWPGTSYDEARVLIRAKATVHVIILQGPDGKPVATPAEMKAAMKKANECYAQVGIMLFSTGFQVVAPPTDVNLSDYFDAANSHRDPTTKLTPEEQALFADQSLRTTTLNDIELYIVNDFTDLSFRQGESFPSAFSANQNPNFVDSLIVSAARLRVNPYVIAHEIGHLLTNEAANAGHYVGPGRLVNLMSGDQPASFDPIYMPKRLTVGQQLAMDVVQNPQLLDYR